MDDDRGTLLNLLVRRLVASDDQFREFRPALQALVAGAAPPTLFELAEALDGAGDPKLIELRRRIEQRLISLARRARALRQEGRGWSDTMRVELAYLDAVAAKRAAATRSLELIEAMAQRLERGAGYEKLHGRLGVEDVPWEAIPWRAICRDFGMEALALPESRAAEAEPRSALELLASDDPELAPVVERIAEDRAVRRRLAVGYALLYGTPGTTPREVVLNRMHDAAARQESLERRGARLAERYPEQLARIIADLAPDATDAMRARFRARPEPEPEEKRPEPARAPAPVAPAAPPPEPAPSKPSPPPSPSIWRKHLQPFLLENWYVAVGALMVVVGSSLLAYFTWERHWAVRYTVLPALLGAFTATLAWLGRWLERRDATLQGTGAVLRGAAIALLPINFMTVALLANDPQIGHPRIVVPLVAATYLGLFGFGLRRWCAEVHPALGGLLGGTLTALCALVLLRPLAVTLAVDKTTVRTVLGIGFHVGFAGLALAVLGFTSRVLDEDLARGKRVPWFFGATLLLTYLQVFAWVHASMGHLPRAYTYAPLLILSGALILHTERRVLALSGGGERLGAESFLGYAVVLLGLLMGQTQPAVRVLAFALAGVVWLRQATPRGDRLHAWIGLTLLALAGASLSLLPGFPGAWRAWLGLGVAIGFGAAALGFGRRGAVVLAETARSLQVVLVVLSSVVAMLAQWHYASAPLATAALLLVAAGLLFLRAHRESRERWVLTGAVLLALALPYLGCVDLAGRSWHGNTMVFGLGALSLAWVALDFLRPTRLTRRARSTVLWFYGALAVAGMTLRVFLETGTLHPVLDHSGPLLSALALVFATYWSRSLVPAGMGAIILVILFPELRAHYAEAFERIGWGTGLGSTVASLALVLGCFVLRRLPRLQRLEGGDRFLGRAPFPVRRHDWTLFTLPIVASVVFLLLKTGTLVLVRNVDEGMTRAAASAQVVAGVAWIVLAVYGRRSDAARQAVRLGFLQVFAGLVLWPSREWIWSAPLLIEGAALSAFAFAIRRRGPGWAQPLLAAPAAALVRRGAFVVAPLCLVALCGPDVPLTTHALVAFTGGALLLGAVTRRLRRYGGALFPLLLFEALYWTRGDAVSVLRITPWHFLVTGSALALAVQALDTLAARRRMLAVLLRPVLRPSHLWSIAFVLFASTGACHAVVTGARFDLAGLAVVAAAAFGAACTHRSGGFLVLGSLVVYFACTHGAAHALDFVAPWKLGTYALAIAVAGSVGMRWRGRLPAAAEPIAFDRVPVPLWMAATAASAGLAAATLQWMVPMWRGAAAQLPASYLAAAAWFLAGRMVRTRETGYGAAALLTLANTHLVRVLAGPWLAGHGITAIQVAGLGIALTLACALLVRRRVRATDIVDHTTALLATLLLVLLATQYVALPDIAAMTVPRLLVSGALAYGAAFAFRTLARHPHDPVAVPVRFAESAYHLGLTVALWCVALIVPWFRQPSAALVALSVPFFFFVVRADLLRGGTRETERSYVESASVLGYLLLGLYLSRSIFQVVFFPGTPVLTDHYHTNAPLVMAVGLGLMRLHVHGHGYWRAFYGGVALIAGSYFAVTAFPGLSPFGNPAPAGWALLALAHFWTLASSRRSPVRTALQQLAGLDDDQWHALRRGWGFLLLVAAQVPPLLVALDPLGDTRFIAPMLAGSASLLVHHAALRRLPLYYAAAAIEVLAALHMDLLVPSYLPWQWVIWILLAVWAAMLLRDAWERLPLRAVEAGANVLAVLVAGHVLLHHPGSGVGWVGFAAATLLLLATPRALARWSGDARDGWTPLLLLAPAWLAYFAVLQGRAYDDAWPVLVGLLALLATGAGAAWIRVRAVPFPAPERPRLAHRLFDLMRRRGDRLGALALYVAFAAASAIFVLHYGRPFETRELACLCVLLAGSAVGFHYDGQARRAMLPYYLLQLAVLALFAAIRRQLMLTTDYWTHEYDVWAACATTVALAGAKEVWDLRPREVGVPVTTALFVLPVVAIIWTVVHGLGVNVALLVLGVHSLTYSFLGRDDRESPYNLVAVAGFVGFVMLTFWSKLELRSLQAFVLPVGIGVLVLTQLFRARMSAGVRNQVRFVAVAAMIGTSAYEALLDPRYPVAFHLSLLLLGLAGMALGGFLRVRIYLLTGCGAVLVALGSVVYRGLAGLEQAARMSAVGVLVLLLGAGLVAGAIYYKTHRERVNATIDGWRRRLGEWD